MSSFPVAWQTWDAGRALATTSQRPLLVLSGPGGCPVRAAWLVHVASDRLAASFVNSHVVPVLLDRWRHPAQDAIAMDVCYRCTNAGGWPVLSTWMPDGRPTSATSDLPADPEELVRLIQALSGAWRTERGAFEEAASALASDLAPNLVDPHHQVKPDAHYAVRTIVAALSAQDMAGHPHLPALDLLATAAALGNVGAGTRLDAVLDAVVDGLVSKADGSVARCSDGQGFDRPRADRAPWAGASLLRLLARRPTPSRLRPARQIAAWLLSLRNDAGAWTRPGAHATNGFLTGWIAACLAEAGRLHEEAVWVEAAAAALRSLGPVEGPVDREPGTPGVLADTAAVAVAALALHAALPETPAWLALAHRCVEVATAAFVPNGIPVMTTGRNDVPWHRADLLDDEVPSGASLLTLANQGLAAHGLGVPLDLFDFAGSEMNLRPVGTAGLWVAFLEKATLTTFIDDVSGRVARRAWDHQWRPGAQLRTG